jgi:hypothetical protein
MKSFMNYVLNKYLNFITQIHYDFVTEKFTIPKWWIVTRFILHWLTLPIKLFIIWLLLIYDIVYQYIFYHIKLFYIDTNIYKLKILFNRLPVLTGVYSALYVNRVPLSQIPDGKNHNTDHQAARQGVYTFLLKRLNQDWSKAVNTLGDHLHQQFGCIRGYNVKEYNTSDVSGEQLLNLCFGVHEIPLRTDDEEEAKPGLIITEKLELAIYAILKNDYALSVKMHEKSKRGMFQPGLETVGAQALVILAILKFGLVKLRLRDVAPYYNSLMWKYGYGLLALFPTAWLPFKRNLSNDVNCMTAAYLLAKLSENRLSKLYWTLVMFNIWLLSFKTYNAYITGMLNEIAPWLLTKSYIKKCQAHLNETDLSGIGYYKFKSNKPFVKHSEWVDGEFLPEEGINDFADPEREPYHSGLGPLAALVLINPEATKQLSEALNEKRTV